MYQKGRRSIIAKCDIPVGVAITRDMLVVKRPGYGISPKFMDIVVGRTAQLDIKEDEKTPMELVRKKFYFTTSLD